MVKMVNRMWKIGRRIAIAYVLLGCVYFAWWFFVYTPAGTSNPLVEGLFYVFLPALFAAPYALLQVVCDEIGVRIRRSRERDSETGVEDI